MEAMRKTWTDERLDDFATHTGQRFDAVDKRFDRVDKRFDRVDAELARVNDRIDGLQRTLLQTNVLIIAALIGLIAIQL